MSKHETKENEGIIIGFNKIPIHKEVLSQMKELNLDPDYVSKCLEANRHNNATTAYYLSLKKHISDGGSTSSDLSSKSIDKSMIEPNKRKATVNNFIMDNFFTKSTESETLIKRKSKSKDKIEKENRCTNVPNSVVTSVNTESKRIKLNSKSKINDSFNYGRVGAVNKSIEKSSNRR